MSTRITPACRSSAQTVASGIRVTGTACPGGALPLCRAPLTTTTGLTAAVRRASRVNLRGLPMDSRYSRTTSVSGSSYQYCRKSLPETSARLPAEMKEDSPAPRRCSPDEQGDADRAGLGEQADAARRPGGSGASEALSRTAVGGVDDAEGVRADDAHAVRAGLPDQFALALPPGGAALGVSGGEHDQSLDAVLAAVGDDVGHLLGGDGDDREVDRLRRSRRRSGRPGRRRSRPLVLGRRRGSRRTYGR